MVFFRRQLAVAVQDDTALKDVF